MKIRRYSKSEIQTGIACNKCSCVEALYWQLLRGYEYLSEQRGELVRTVHAHMTSKPKWQ
jgi:hypothetical protein